MCSRLQPSCVQVIQRVVRSRFPDSTILTIAHRLDTVIDYDHLLLMAEGHVAEARPTDMMCSVMCMCMYGVHTVAHTVAARQAAHINMPCTCTCTCACCAALRLQPLGLRLYLGGSPSRAARTARLALLGPRRQWPGRGAAACHRRRVSVQGGKCAVGRPLPAPRGGVRGKSRVATSVVCGFHSTQVGGGCVARNLVIVFFILFHF